MFLHAILAHPLSAGAYCRLRATIDGTLRMFCLNNVVNIRPHIPISVARAVGIPKDAMRDNHADLLTCVERTETVMFSDEVIFLWADYTFLLDIIS